MELDQTALVLIGFQNDYFLEDGLLHAALESSEAAQQALSNTVALLEQIKDTDVLIVNAPIVFTEDYAEIIQPVGILKVIADVGAFQQGAPGSETVDQIKALGERIVTVPGKRGLNAFSNTSLKDVLNSRKVTTVVFAGAVTSVCIDTTARTALDMGYAVTILSDCTAGRSRIEQSFYCEEIFPLYAESISSAEWLQQHLLPAAS